MKKNKDSIKTISRKTRTESATRLIGTKSARKVSEDFSKESQRFKERSWYIFVLAYIGLADSGCDHLIDIRLSENNKYIVVGIIYNLKHSLEILVKSIGKSFNIESDTEKTHNTKELFRKLLASKTLKNMKDGPKKKIYTEIIKLKPLISKYDELPLLREYLKGNFIVGDYENILFKYPENAAKLIINYAELLNQINKVDIKNIKKDLKIIFNIVQKIKPAIK